MTDFLVDVEDYLRVRRELARLRVQNHIAIAALEKIVRFRLIDWCIDYRPKSFAQDALDKIKKT